MTTGEPGQYGTFTGVVRLRPRVAAPTVIAPLSGRACVAYRLFIDEAIAEIFAANAPALARFRGGEEKLFGFFMGQVMRATKGKADPAAAKARLEELIRD